MPTLLVRNVPESLMRELRRLKVELGCRTWAELLDRLVRVGAGGVIVIEKEDMEEMRKAIDGFLELREIVTSRWGEGTVLDELRRARGHEDSDIGR